MKLKNSHSIYRLTLTLLLCVLFLSCAKRPVPAKDLVPATIPTPIDPTKYVPQILEYTQDLAQFPKLDGENPAYDPQISFDSKRASGPQIAEWSRTASANDTVVLSGSDFGTDTQFHIFSEATGSSAKWALAKALRLNTDSAAIQIPSDFPENSLYLIVPERQKNFGAAIRINAPEIWWMNEQTFPNANAVIYGRNLTLKRGAIAKVFIRKVGDTVGTWAQIVSANPYKIEFTVPPILSNATYEALVHTGEGDKYGWSQPKSFKIVTKYLWNGPILNVTDPKYGAVGNNSTDNTNAINLAIADAIAIPNSTIYFPAGIYLIKQTITPPSFTKWLGQSKTDTILRLSQTGSSAFFSTPPALPNKSISFENFTLDANGMLSNNPQGLIYMRLTDNLQIKNMIFNSIGFLDLDLAGSKNVQISNSEVIGMGAFLAGTVQVFLNTVNFFGTNDVGQIISLWKSEGVSIERCSAKDFNRNLVTGWALGRFVVVQGHWGTNSNIYYSENSTLDMGYRPPPAVLDHNVGEQFLQEGAVIYAEQRGVTATANSITFNTAMPVYLEGEHKGKYLDLTGEYVRIIRGRGMGQFRKINSVQSIFRNSFILDRPWNVIPDSTSFVQIGAGLLNAAIYNNYFQAKNYAATEVEHNGSNAVQCYGGCQNFEVVNNRMDKVRYGVSMWGLHAPNSLLGNNENINNPTYFTLVQDNTITNARWGLAILSADHTLKTHTSLFGTIYRRNTIEKPLESAVILADDKKTTGLLNKMNVLEANKIIDAKAVIVSDEKGGFSTANVEDLIIQNNNATNKVYSNAACFQLFPTTRPLIENNICEGYAK